jgi:TPP-dependent pyruvate/acetoin dehydrogenase alpha subunit
LRRFRQVLNDRGVTSDRELDDIDKMAKDYAAREADLAVDEPMPDPATVTRGVYAGDDFAVPRIELVKSPFARADLPPKGGSHENQMEEVE